MDLPIHHIPLEAARGAFKPCRWCGGELATFEAAPVVKPAEHAARVKCENCGRQTAWASNQQVRKAVTLTGMDAVAQRYVEHVIPFDRKQVGRFVAAERSKQQRYGEANV